MMSTLRYSFRPAVKSAVSWSETRVGLAGSLLKSSLRGGVAPSAALRNNHSGCKICVASCTDRKNFLQKNLSTQPSPKIAETINGAFSDSQANSTIISAKKTVNGVELTMSCGLRSSYPSTWLRDNCQCSKCFNNQALGRSLLMENLELDPGMQDVSVTQSGDLNIDWEDGHQSSFKADWLRPRAFTVDARQRYRHRYQLPKTQWGSDHKVATFDYSSLMKDDRALLHWLVEQETSGATLLKGTPGETAAAFNLCERIAKAKYTHFGDYSSVVNHPNANNLAYTGQSLNLHNDMPQYQEIPGLIFLHMVKQHTGEGGDTTISDGLAAAEQMRKNHPRQFELLIKTDVYFWDKGDVMDEMMESPFYKINKGPTIQLDNNGEVSIIRFNNQVRDSFLDLPSERVNEFYAALKTYFSLMYANSICYKMQNGDMTILDNVRCQHGREAFHGNQGSRHLVTTFMTWDEALCRRRRLQEQLY